MSSELILVTAAIDHLADRGRRIAARLHIEEDGQDLIEYAGILAVVAVIIAALITAGPTVADAIKSAVAAILKG